MRDYDKGSRGYGKSRIKRGDILDTPIIDFIKKYGASGSVRLHMPGHKGINFTGCEKRDITEISGADSLYEANGIILKSEMNASKLFGTKRTLYSTEGSSQCIRAMLFLAMLNSKIANKKPVIVAARNAHKTFITAAALLNFDIVWLYPENEEYSLCRCDITKDTLEKTLNSLNEPPCAVYITSPDYLGGQADIEGFAETAHKHNTLLLVDNAHGAYLHFCETRKHPMDHGADICCDSAHKTLPVLTGGAYLHIGRNTDDFLSDNARRAMSLFGSTSPSYLILQSLDYANRYIARDYSQKLTNTINRLDSLKLKLKETGFSAENSDPLKLTVNACKSGFSGIELSDILRKENIECEYADHDFSVMMFTPENKKEDFEKLLNTFKSISIKKPMKRESLYFSPLKRVCSVREAILSQSETISIEKAAGRVAAAPAVSCPPAVAIAVSGEEITENTIKIFKYYGIKTVEVIK